MWKLLPILLFSSFSQGQMLDNNHELLWEISGNGLKEKSYLFGSFHSNDRRLFNLSDSTYFALSKVENIVLEADMFSLFNSWDTRTSAVKLKYDNEGQPYVSNSDPTETYYGNEDGMPQFLDAYIQQYCLNANKQFIPLESVDFQIDLLSDLSLTGVSNFKTEALLMTGDQMLEEYIKGDIHKLDQMLKSSLSMYPEGYQKLIVDRNKGMATKLDSILRTSSTFCAIGAGHLAGPEGVINQLRRRGYNLRKVMASYSEMPTSYKKEILSKRSYEYHDPSLGLHVIFPGKPIVNDDEVELYAEKLIFREYGQGNTYEVEIHVRDEDIGLAELASMYIASPSESPYQAVFLDNGGEAYQGIADAYPDGIYWIRIIMSEDIFLVIKAYGGNKFMNSKRAHKFFDNVWFE